MADKSRAAVKSKKQHRSDRESGVRLKRALKANIQRRKQQLRQRQKSKITNEAG